MELEKPCRNSWYAKLENGYHVAPYDSGHNKHHRYIYARHHEYVFQPGDVVMHLCDNKSCIEITHLKLGTQKDNVRDCINKGRRGDTSHKGEDHPFSYLREYEVLEIRKLSAEGVRNVDLADQFHVSRSMISSIIHRRYWKHI